MPASACARRHGMNLFSTVCVDLRRLIPEVVAMTIGQHASHVSLLTAVDLRAPYIYTYQDCSPSIRGSYRRISAAFHLERLEHDMAITMFDIATLSPEYDTFQHFMRRRRARYCHMIGRLLLDYGHRNRRPRISPGYFGMSAPFRCECPASLRAARRQCT